MAIITQLASGATLSLYTLAALHSQFDAKEKRQDLHHAIFLTGLSRFVDERCPHLRTNRTVLFSAVAHTEVDINEIRKEGFVTRANNVRDKLAEDEKASCQMALRDYGPYGAVTPRIFSPR